MLRYLAYGSNLHPLRLTARVPSARFAAVVRLPGLALAFHKRGGDGSGKCLISPAPEPGSAVHGVVYEMAADEKHLLDAIEGPGYFSATMTVALAHGGQVEAFVYLARDSHVEPGLLPYHWYKDLVLAGARNHRLPADYIASILQTPSKPDPDLARRHANESLLLRIGEGAG